LVFMAFLIRLIAGLFPFGKKQPEHIVSMISSTEENLYDQVSGLPVGPY
jgi:hypothetical protein